MYISIHRPSTSAVGLAVVKEITSAPKLPPFGYTECCHGRKSYVKDISIIGDFSEKFAIPFVKDQL